MQTDTNTAIDRSQKIIDAILEHIDECDHQDTECCCKLMLRRAFE